MSKKFICLALVILSLLVFAGCNRQLIDTNFYFNRAILMLPNGEVVEGNVTSWRDFEDGDQIQVTMNGVTYLVHSSNVALIAG